MTSRKDNILQGALLGSYWQGYFEAQGLSLEDPEVMEQLKKNVKEGILSGKGEQETLQVKEMMESPDPTSN
jgi:hypothetical protein